MKSDETVEIRSEAELHEWLLANAGRTTGLWLVTFKQGSAVGRPVTYSQIVDELLCFGWIDSLPRKLDDERSMLWISPRRPRSAWSKVNKLKIEVLATSGRLQPSALALIEQAKSSGTWDRLNGADEGVVPEDLAAELGRYQTARGFFDAFPRSARRGILEWIAQARTPETRAKRIAEAAVLASENRRALQWKKKQET